MPPPVVLGLDGMSEQGSRTCSDFGNCISNDAHGSVRYGHQGLIVYSEWVFTSWFTASPVTGSPDTMTGEVSFFDPDYFVMDLKSICYEYFAAKSTGGN
jgi:hypothetical protein